MPSSVRQSRAALRDLEAREAAFVASVEDWLASKLAEADAVAPADPAAAGALRTAEAAIAESMDEITAAREQREAQAAPDEPGRPAAYEAAPAEAPAAPPAPPAPPPPLPYPAGSASGSVAHVACPGGGDMTVDSSIVGSAQAMLDAAHAAGVGMCGGGFRSHAEQIALRRAHCGGSDHAIYQAPPSSCSPPTACTTCRPSRGTGR
jgi:hypothetical protein